MSHNKLNIILASGSSARKKMLKNAGLNFKVIPANIDETSIINEMCLKSASIKNIATKLAEEKALYISKKHPKTIVIGSDQILVCEKKIFSKAKNLKESIKNLKELRGKSHFLISAVCIAKDNKIIWKTSRLAELSMSKFDDKFLDAYIKKSGDILTKCVGGYAIEQNGIWLFEKIKGDYFTIMGMPLIPLLSYLKKIGFKP